MNVAMRKPLILFLTGMLLFNGDVRAQKPQVTVQVTIITKNEPGIIPYARSRALAIADFQGKPDAASPGVAATYSGIEMGISSRTDGSRTVVAVTLFPYFKTGKSWMKTTGKSPEVLAHEQLHFDLTAIQTCHLQMAIEKEVFYHNWQQQLRDLRNRYLKELAQRQNQYDKDTRHGTLEEVQQKYDQQIKAQLKDLPCYQ